MDDVDDVVDDVVVGVGVVVVVDGCDDGDCSDGESNEFFSAIYWSSVSLQTTIATIATDKQLNLVFKSVPKHKLQSKYYIK